MAIIKTVGELKKFIKDIDDEVPVNEIPLTSGILIHYFTKETLTAEELDGWERDLPELIFTSDR